MEDIADLRDESDRHGVRVVIELKRGANAEIILNQLYKHTDLQVSFSYNMVVLDRGMPRLSGVLDILRCFLAHREEVVTRRSRFRLAKARDRAHILVGLGVAVANIDEVIKLIRNAGDPIIAKAALMERGWPATAVAPLLELLGEAVVATDYKLSAIQAQAILDLRLHRLTGLERDKILAEASDIAEVIRDLLNILSHRHVLLEVVREELQEVRSQFATPRLTEIQDGGADMHMEDLIQPEDVVVTISSDAYVKRVPLAAYRAQRRGGKGKAAASLRDNEEMATLFVANTHDPLLFFTNLGNVFKLKTYELPMASATTRGKAFSCPWPRMKLWPPSCPSRVKLPKMRPTTPITSWCSPPALAWCAKPRSLPMPTCAPRASMAWACTMAINSSACTASCAVSPRMFCSAAKTVKPCALVLRMKTSGQLQAAPAAACAA